MNEHSNMFGGGRTATEEGKKTASLQLVHLKKEFGDITAVDGVDIDVEAGDLLVLLGPSGCGKTTTLKMIAGIETVTSGKIMVGGKDMTNELPKDRDASMIFQSYALYPHKSVRGNLKFPLGKMDLTNSEKERKIEQVAELLEISDLLDKDPDQLSGGQRQRVAVGRSIIREPQLFLMDEPLSNLDAKLRESTRSEIKALQEQLGTTTVYVTHNQGEAMSLADHIAIMKDGNIEQQGTPKEIYKNPKNEFIAKFIGEPSINIFDNNSPVISKMINEIPTHVQRIGVRPEHIHLQPTPSNIRASSGFDFTVRLIEMIGHEYELTLMTGDLQATVTVENLPESLTEGDEVKARIDLDNIYLFDDNGNTIEGRVQ